MRLNTAGTPFGAVPAESGKAICRMNFAALQALFSPAELCAAVSLYLSNMDQHLLRIAQSRAGRDFAAVAREAYAIGRIAENLGAMRVKKAAHLLEAACHTGDTAATYGLIGGLSQAFEEADSEWNDWQSLNPSTDGP